MAIGFPTKTKGTAQGLSRGSVTHRVDADIYNQYIRDRKSRHALQRVLSSPVPVHYGVFRVYRLLGKHLAARRRRPLRASVRCQGCHRPRPAGAAVSVGRRASPTSSTATEPDAPSRESSPSFWADNARPPKARYTNSAYGPTKPHTSYLIL